MLRVGAKIYRKSGSLTLYTHIAHPIPSIHTQLCYDKYEVTGALGHWDIGIVRRNLNFEVVSTF